jgi:hypothetical protein
MILTHMFLFFVDSTTGNPSFSESGAPTDTFPALMTQGVGF